MSSMFDLRRTGPKLIIALSIGLCAFVCMSAGGLTLFRQARTLALGPSSTSVPIAAAPLYPTPTQARQPAVPTWAPTAASTPVPVAVQQGLQTTAFEAGAAPVGPTSATAMPYPPVASPVPTAAEQSPSTAAAASGRLAAPETRPQTFNVILLGSDRNETGKGTWRTDVMALVALEPESHTAGVLAIPRDLYVNIPNHDPDRINTVDFLGHYTKYPGDGQALLNDTLHENFGFGFDRYIRIDFNGFAQIIDELGGIDVDVDCPLEERFADPGFCRKGGC